MCRLSQVLRGTDAESQASLPGSKHVVQQTQASIPYCRQEFRAKEEEISQLPGLLNTMGSGA